MKDNFKKIITTILIIFGYIVVVVIFALLGSDVETAQKKYTKIPSNRQLFLVTFL